MKVYLGFTNKEHDGHLQFLHYLQGLYPINDDLLWVTDSPPEQADLWAQMEAHDISFEHVYEIDLPHSPAELAPYRLSEDILAKLGATAWRLPWYVVAGHPVKIMEASIEHRIMGVSDDGGED